MSAVETATYRGIDRTGTGRTGVVPPGDLAGWVQRKFESGWVSLDVRNASDNMHVAGIELHPDTGKRIWWSS